MTSRGLGILGGTMVFAAGASLNCSIFGWPLSLGEHFSFPEIPPSFILVALSNWCAVLLASVATGWKVYRFAEHARLKFSISLKGIFALMGACVTSAALIKWRVGPGYVYDYVAQLTPAVSESICCLALFPTFLALFDMVGHLLPASDVKTNKYQALNSRRVRDDESTSDEETG